MPKEDTQFKKGTSGNPNGRAKGVFSITRAMGKWLMQKDAESGLLNGDVFVENVMIAASEGNSEWAKQIMNRLEGPMPTESKIDVTTGGKPLGEMSADEIERKALEILARRTGDTPGVD